MGREVATRKSSYCTLNTGESLESLVDILSCIRYNI